MAAGHKIRHNAVDFTGCLAHAEITYLQSTQKILRIRGHFHHNEGCKKALIMRFPAVPLHPAVYEVALQQLKEGCTLTDVQERNHTMVQPWHIATSLLICRDLHTVGIYDLRDKDTRSLYRQFNHLQGIKSQSKAHLNIDEWLDPDSAQFNQTLHDVVFHYSPRATWGEQVEICIATPEMREAAWKYAHQSQIILDGTFGSVTKNSFIQSLWA